MPREASKVIINVCEDLPSTYIPPGEEYPVISEVKAARDDKGKRLVAYVIADVEADKIEWVILDPETDEPVIPGYIDLVCE